MQVKGLKELTSMVCYRLIRILSTVDRYDPAVPACAAGTLLGLFQAFLRPLLANVSTTVRITRESMNRTHTGSCT